MICPTLSSVRNPPSLAPTCVKSKVWARWVTPPINTLTGSTIFVRLFLRCSAPIAVLIMLPGYGAEKITKVTGANVCGEFLTDPADAGSCSPLSARLRSADRSAQSDQQSKFPDNEHLPRGSSLIPC